MTGGIIRVSHSGTEPLSLESLDADVGLELTEITPCLVACDWGGSLEHRARTARP